MRRDTEPCRFTLWSCAHRSHCRTQHCSWWTTIRHIFGIFLCSWGRIHDSNRVPLVTHTKPASVHAGRVLHRFGDISHVTLGTFNAAPLTMFAPPKSHPAAHMPCKAGCTIKKLHISLFLDYPAPNLQGDSQLQFGVVARCVFSFWISRCCWIAM